MCQGTKRNPCKCTKEVYKKRFTLEEDGVNFIIQDNITNRKSVVLTKSFAEAMLKVMDVMYARPLVPAKALHDTSNGIQFLLTDKYLMVQAPDDVDFDQMSEYETVAIEVEYLQQNDMTTIQSKLYNETNASWNHGDLARECIEVYQLLSQS
jgi:hypothetical protein